MIVKMKTEKGTFFYDNKAKDPNKIITADNDYLNGWLDIALKEPVFVIKKDKKILTLKTNEKNLDEFFVNYIPRLFRRIK